MREDNRANTQVRAIESEQGLLSRADGSARYSHDKTSVLVGVFGPLEAKISRQLIDRACIEVYWVPQSGNADYTDREQQLFIQNTLENIIITTLYPRSVITVIVQVLNDGGSILSAVLNGICLALLDAGLAMNSLAVSISCCIVEDSILLDPILTEEGAASATSTFVFSSIGNTLLLSTTSGTIDQQILFKLLEISRSASQKILAFMRLATEKKSTKKTFLSELHWCILCVGVGHKCKWDT